MTESIKQPGLEVEKERMTGICTRGPARYLKDDQRREMPSFNKNVLSNLVY